MSTILMPPPDPAVIARKSQIVAALRGALPDNYFSRLGLDASKLAALIDSINNIDTLIDEKGAKSEQDIVGRVYEYFLGKFAATEGKGGGMHNNLFSSLTLTNCTFTDNTANYGGGMFNDDSSPTLTDCTFENNTANDGGGMRNVDNAGLGGGMHNYNSSPTLTDCTFTNNTTDGKGGGMYNHLFSSPTLTNCTFTYNTVVDDGGGMYNYVDSSPHLIDCIFENNIANGNGGGMLNIINSNPTLTDTTVCGNTPDQIIGDWTDNGGNWVADECPSVCPDINGDGYVNVSDLLAVIDQWGLTNSPADINFDGIVDVSDLLIVIGNWGPCE